MKDNFSAQSSKYAKFRPTYPKELYDFLMDIVPQKHTAWDCATGNGQVAVELAIFFNKVYATDISVTQLSEALERPNIYYQEGSAEHTNFKDNAFDLITVGQAIHWFKFDDFFLEIKRVLKPNGIFAAFGYGLMKISEEIDPLVYRLYEDILGSYWDAERKHIEDGYSNIPFPFQQISNPTFSISTSWSFSQLIGYLETWSSLQHYVKAKGNNPIEFVYHDLAKAWGNEPTKIIHFPIILKVFRADMVE